MIRVRNETDGIDSMLELNNAIIKMIELKPPTPALQECLIKLRSTRDELTAARADLERVRPASLVK